MQSWTEGYVSDIPYSSGFYREMTPSHLRFAALSLGHVADRPSSYLELGSGQGFGLALLAAVEPEMRFHGVDFNPEHIVTSRRIASGAGLGNVEFEEASFEEVAGRGEAGEFDCVGLHGILTWVSPASQAAIVAILGRRLAPGGLAYVSYNSMPGWAEAAPLQYLMRALARRAPSGRSDGRVEHALKAMQAMKEGGARYFTRNPDVVSRLERMPDTNRTYLAHEYLNEHWRPLHFAEVAAMMEPAKLGFLGSATLTEDIDAVAVPEELHALCAEAGSDVVWQETLRDYASNKQFRRDIFARGLPAADGLRHGATLDASAFVLARNPDDVRYKFTGPLGEIEGHLDVYEPLVRRLAESQVATFAELAALPVFAAKGRGTLLQSLTLLVHSGQVLPVPAGEREAANASCRRFNRFVTSAIESGYSHGFLASPVAATGVPAGTADLLALSAIHAGCTDDDALARHVFATLDRRGERPLRDGQPIADEGEAIAKIASELGPHAASQVPVWRRLGIL